MQLYKAPPALASGVNLSKKLGDIFSLSILQAFRSRRRPRASEKRKLNQRARFIKQLG